MIYNKFINCETKDVFKSRLSSGDIVNQHIVFIQDTKEIWTDGVYYATQEIISADLEKLSQIVDILVTNGDGSKVLADNGTYVKLTPFSQSEITKLEAIAGIIITTGDGSKVLADNGTYVAIPKLTQDQANKLSELSKILILNGDGTKVLANNGKYVDYGKVGTSTVGSNTKFIYLNAGTPTASSSTVGSATLPIYLNGGNITQCNNTLGVSITGNANTATYVTRDRGSNTVSTLASLPVTKSTIVANLSGATNISLAGDMNVGESMTIICNPSASFTQPLPDSGNFMSMDGSSLNISSGKVFEINIYCYATNKYSISCKVKR